MDIDRYCERIGFTGPLRADLETLIAIHRAHLLAIPYENLDIHLGRRLGLEVEPHYRKLVVGGRGGWCYEMNGLLAAVLERIGFRVTMAWGTVGRALRGDGVEGNHLVLLVHLDRPYLTDVGFGDGTLDPLPLVVGQYRSAGFEVGIARVGSRWVFQNHPHGAATEFDFEDTPRRLTDFALRCHALQTAPDSTFVQKTVVQRHQPGGIVTLRGAVRSWVTPDGVERTTVKNCSEFQQVLADDFGIDLAEHTAPLWASTEVRHQQWLADTASRS